MEEEMKRLILRRLRLTFLHIPAEQFDFEEEITHPVADIIKLAKAGVRCCQDPRCPINFAIDVALAALQTKSECFAAGSGGT